MFFLVALERVRTNLLPVMGVRTAVLILSSAFILTGCNRAPQATQTTSIPSETKTNSGTQTFHVRGVIQEFRPADKEIVIKHEDIPDYMPAMTMPFPVKSTNEFAGLRTNDQVTFTMIVTDKDGWIQDLKKIGVDTNSLGSAQERPKMRLVRDVEPLKGGDKMPNYTFTNSLGKKVNLSDLAGQAYAFTFMFTRCPFPTFCPRMSSNYSEAFKLLSTETNNVRNWHLLTISFDPEFDTPERLKEYSEYYHPDPKKWDFLTGAMIDVDAITEQVGLVFAYEKGTFNHNLRTVVIDKNGQLRMIFKGNEWKPEELAAEIVAGASGEPIPQDRIGQTEF